MADGNTQMMAATAEPYGRTNKINNTTWSRDAVNPEASTATPITLRWETRLSRKSELNRIGGTGRSFGPQRVPGRRGMFQLHWVQPFEPPRAMAAGCMESVADTIKTYSWRAIYAKELF